MAFLFGDSFDFYGSISDTSLRYLVGANSFSSMSLITDTAFGTGQALHGMLTGTPPAALFPTNETTVYGSLRLRFPNVTSTPAARFSLTFGDGTNNQCSINWYGDGSVVLRSGSSSGAALASLAAGAGFAQNAWDSWQFKVVIDGTAGSIELRKNGATAAILSVSGVNTRAGSTNSYANQVTLSNPNVVNGQFDLDDLFFCSASGAAPTTWPGDLRAVQQVPASAVQAQFSPNVTTFFSQGSSGTTATYALPANAIRLASVVATQPGTLIQGSLNLASGATGHVQMAVYDATGSGGGAGNLIDISAEVVNPAAGVVAFAFSGGKPIARGSTYWVGPLSDVPLSVIGTTNIIIDQIAATYAAGFPATGSGATNAFTSGLNSAGFTVAVVDNSPLVQLSDGDGTYVSSATASAEDIYALSAVPTGYAVVGVTYYVQWKKPDVGPRTAALMLSANGSADAAVASDTTLSTSSYVLDQAFLGLDPTGTAWTPVVANAAKLGIKIAA